jgi:hypothetical protein
MHTLKLYLKSGDKITDINSHEFMKFNISYSQESDSMIKFEVNGPF